MSPDLVSQMQSAASDPPVDAQERRKLYNAAMDLAMKIESPFDAINRICLSFGNLTTSKVFVDLKVFQKLAEQPEREWTVSELAKDTGADIQLMERLLRYQSAAYNVEEASTGKFKASCKTGFLALPGTEAAINHNFLTVSNNFLHLPLFLADSGYENPGDSANTPAHLAFNHEGDLSTWFATHPVHAAAAFGFFATQRADQQGCFTKAPLNMYALQGTEQDEKRVLLCDVGGGAGHQCLAFRTQRPELEGLLAVTDLSIMIEQQDQAALRAQGIISLADDFFSAEDYPAAVRSAKMYYLRNILHDWNDEQSVKILRRIRKVAAKDSVLLVDEIIIPDAGASIAACNMDLSMMTISSAERSASQWRFLLSEAGFEVEKMWCYDEDRGDHLITATCSPERC